MLIVATGSPWSSPVGSSAILVGLAGVCDCQEVTHTLSTLSIYLGLSFHAAETIASGETSWSSTAVDCGRGNVATLLPSNVICLGLCGREAVSASTSYSRNLSGVSCP